MHKFEKGRIIIFSIFSFHGKMLKDYSAMSEAERKAELRRLRDDLNDLEETFQFHMKNTSDHISVRAAIVKSIRILN